MVTPIQMAREIVPLIIQHDKDGDNSVQLKHNDGSKIDATLFPSLGWVILSVDPDGHERQEATKYQFVIHEETGLSQPLAGQDFNQYNEYRWETTNSFGTPVEGEVQHANLPMNPEAWNQLGAIYHRLTAEEANIQDL